MARARDEQLIAAFTIVLVAGYVIESIDGTVRVERTAGSQFIVKVGGDALGLIRDETFEDARSAVSYYLDLCDPADFHSSPNP
jgi:hypothetical protein